MLQATEQPLTSHEPRITSYRPRPFQKYGIQVAPVTHQRRARVSVIVPTLNEAKNLPHVLPLIPDWVDEVILVDGNSTDDTVEVARSLLPDIRVVMQQGRGKGNALREGFAAATGDIIVMIDADGSTDPREIPAFVGALESGADFAKGSRFLHGAGTADMEFHRMLGNWVFVFLSRLLFGGRYTDLCYGYNAFWRHVLPRLDLDADGFEIETQMNLRALAAGLKVIEVVSHEHPRIYGDSNLHAIKDGWRVLKTIFKEYIRRRLVRQTAPPEPAYNPVTSTSEPVQLLLNEALHLVLHSGQELSAAACRDALMACNQSLSAIMESTVDPYAHEQAGEAPVDLQFLVRLQYRNGNQHAEEWNAERMLGQVAQ